MREFETGATRDDDTAKPDYEGFISPRVIVAYGQYMNKHRRQADGKLRDSDNWQKGIPKTAYMKSLWRHFLDVWLFHRGSLPVHEDKGYDLKEALCGVLFNAMGYLDEILKEDSVRPRQQRAEDSAITAPSGIPS